METFVDQRSRSTLLRTNRKKGNQLKTTCSGVTDERTEKQFLATSYEALNVGNFTWKYILKSGSMSRLPIKEQSKPILWTRPCSDFFIENHVSELFLTNTEEGVASSVALFPASTREQRSTNAFLHKTFSVAKAS